MILDSKGKQIVRLIGFGDRYEAREPEAKEGWLGVSSAAGHSVVMAAPWWNDDPKMAKGTTK